MIDDIDQRLTQLLRQHAPNPPLAPLDEAERIAEAIGRAELPAREVPIRRTRMLRAAMLVLVVLLSSGIGWYLDQSAQVAAVESADVLDADDEFWDESDDDSEWASLLILTDDDL